MGEALTPALSHRMGEGEHGFGPRGCCVFRAFPAMKIRSPLVHRETRLEIIPLIDIMFFLLASFMMVSLQMQKIRTLKANLPTATMATSTAKPDIVNLNVDKFGQVSVDHQPVSLAELTTLLTNRYSLNTNLPVYITGARDATHGSMIYVLDFVKRAGIQRVAIAVKAAPAK
jgi:biopolymer transport protein ExbD